VNERQPHSLRIVDRVLLYLSRYKGRDIDIVAPWALTQEGIASGIGVDRKNVVMPLKDLDGKGCIKVHKRHVKGSKTVRKVYAVTETGLNETKLIIDLIGNNQVTIVDLEGTTREAKLKDIPTFLPMKMDMLDVVLGIDDDRFHCGEFLEKKARLDRKLVDMTERMPVAKNFFGRETELKILRESLSNRATKAIVITGLPGIGKTALASKFVSEIRREQDIFWYRIFDWTGLEGLLTSLGEFLAAQGSSSLLRFLGSGEAINLQRLSLVLANDLRAARGIALFDDFHNADEKIQKAIVMMFDLLQESDSAFKLIIIGRNAPSFDVRDRVISKTVNRIVLGKLDRESCRRILVSREIPSAQHDRALDVGKGYPLFLELMEPELGFQSTEFFDFLQNEILSSLDPSEKWIMTAVSLARYPVLPDALLICAASSSRFAELTPLELDERTQDGITSLRERNLLVDAPYGALSSHDLLKEFISLRATPSMRADIHAGLAEFYLNDDSPFSANESIYHFVSAGELEKSVDIAVTNADEILSRIGHQTLKGLISAATKLKGLESLPAELLLTKAKIDELEGEWDSALAAIDAALSDRNLEEMNADTWAGIRRFQAGLMMRRGDLPKAEKVLMVVRAKAIVMRDDRLRTEVCLDLGNLLHRKGSIEEARIYLEEAIKASQAIDDDLLMGRALYGRSKVVAAEEDFLMAIEIQQDALRRLAQTGAFSDQAKVLTSMGTYYDAIDEYEKAMECQEEALSLAARAGDVVTQAYALANGAVTLISMNNLDEAVENIHAARDIFEKTGDRTMLAMMSFLECNAHIEKEDWLAADTNFQECKTIAEVLDIKYYLGYWLTEIAERYLLHGRKTEASSNLEHALEICEEYSLTALRDDVIKMIKKVEKT